MSDFVVEKLHRLIKECDKHSYRIELAYSKIQGSLPFTVHTYQHLSDDEIEHIDQYLFRFSKLQDTVGQRLFKTTLQYLQEDIEGKPFIDVLNILAKLGFIESSEQWQQLREIRNAIAHEYDDCPELMVQALNACFQAKNDLFEIYLNIKHTFLTRQEN